LKKLLKAEEKIKNIKKRKDFVSLCSNLIKAMFFRKGFTS